MAKLFIEGRRDGYAPDQCRQTMTVGELISYLLANYDEDDETPIYLKNDNGYTYGSITRSSFEMDYDDDDPEDDAEEEDEEDEDGEAEDDYETMEPEEFVEKYINKEDA